MVAMGAFAACVASPCSGVGPPSKPVVFGDQTNIVIWDEANKTEHFIRNASFRSGSENFGFIAPTPGKPELHEASTKAFGTLAALAPPTAFGGGGMGGGFGGGGGFSRSSQVQVIQEADVAGYRATTLWSKSAGAINDWMNEHGYVSTPEIEQWAERYVRKGWYLTAFKVIDRSKNGASTGTVRMTFKTDKAFNPFYVPKTNIRIDGGSTLRLYFVSVGDYEAKIGKTSEVWQTPQWTAKIPPATADLLAQQVQIPSKMVPENAQVATFVDNNFPRPTKDDIFFTKKSPVVAPKESDEAPARTIPPLVAPLLVGIGFFAFARRSKPLG